MVQIISVIRFFMSDSNMLSLKYADNDQRCGVAIIIIHLYQKFNMFNDQNGAQTDSSPVMPEENMVELRFPL